MPLSKRRYSFDIGHLRHDIKERAVRSSGITIFSASLSFVINVMSTMVLARMLTPADFGLITMVTTFSLLLQSFGFNGFTEALIQRESIDHATVSTIFWINAGAGLALTVIFMAFSPLIAYFYKEPRLVNITLVISLSIVGSSLSIIHLALLKRNMQFAASSLILVISRFISVIVAIACAWLGMGYWALAASAIAFPLVSAVGAWTVCRWRPKKPSHQPDVKPIIKFSLHTYGNFALNYGSRNLDNLLVGKFLGIQPLGYYKKAYDLFALSANQLTSPLSTVALATLSKFANDAQKFRQYYLNAISMIAFVSMGLSLILTVAAKDIILLMLGPQWMPSAEIFRFFGPGVGMMLIYATHGWLHLSLGRADRWLRWGIIEFAVTASLFAVGMLYGPSGVALAWTVSYFLLTIPALWYGGRPLNLGIAAIVSAVWRYLAAALSTGALSWYLLSLNDRASSLFRNLALFPRITSSLLLVSMLYLCTTLLFYRNLSPINQLVSLLRMMKPKSKVAQS